MSVAVAAVFVLLILLYAFLPEVATEYGTYGQIPLLTLLLGAYGWRLRQVPAGEERRFWIWLLIGFGIWLANDVLYYTGALALLPVPELLTRNHLHLATFLSMFLALEQRPDLGAGWSQQCPGRSFTTIGTVLFVFGVLAYCVLVPSSLHRVDQTSRVPSFFLFVTLDLVLLARLLAFLRNKADASWRQRYALMAVAVAMWTAMDLKDGILNARGLPVVAGGLIDLVYFGAQGCFALCAAIQPGQSQGGDRSLKRVELPGSSRLLLTYAFLPPVAHIGLHTLGVMDVQLETARGVVILAMLLGMLLLIGLRLRWLQRDYSQLNSAVDSLTISETLHQSQKMEALGRLARGIGHDLNNLLMVIRGSNELAQDQSAFGSPVWQADSRRRGSGQCAGRPTHGGGSWPAVASPASKPEL